MDVLWLHTGGMAAVGIVKKYDPYDHIREHQLSMTYREGGDCQCEAHTGRRQRKTR